jgi:hypothetical protein
MRVYYELDLKNFAAWCGAVETLHVLTDDQINQLEFMMEGAFGDEVSETTVNDFLWFETDTIAEWLGFKNWEELEHINNGEEHYEEIATKEVRDADGYKTEYTMYHNVWKDTYIFMFGDRDVTEPDDDYADYECETLKEAKEWFESYNGFGDEEDEE